MTTHIKNSADMDYATGVARQVCARVFRDGGAPSDALDTFGLAHEDVQASWKAAVDRIAAALCAKHATSKPGAALQRAA